MKNRFAFLFILIIAIGLTSLGYYIDSDPPYANQWHTVFEFGIITLVLFTFISGFYLTIRKLIRMI